MEFNEIMNYISEHGEPPEDNLHYISVDPLCLDAILENCILFTVEVHKNYTEMLLGTSIMLTGTVCASWVQILLKWHVLRYNLTVQHSLHYRARNGRINSTGFNWEPRRRC